MGSTAPSPERSRESAVCGTGRQAAEDVGMRRFLLDSTIASDYINRRHGIFEKARAEVAKGNPIGIAMPVLAELAAGIEHSASRDRNMKSLNSALSALRIWPLDSEAAFEYGRLHAELARLGRPIGVIDTMIAAIA